MLLNFFENINIENKGMVVLSFLLAFGLWASLKLNQSYHTTLEYPCKIYKIPENVYVSRQVIPKLTFYVEGLGNQLLLANFRSKDTLLLRYDERFSQGVVNLRQSLQNFEGLPDGVRLLKTEEDTLHIQTDQLKAKKVPVVLDADIRLAKTYQLEGSPKIEPDSVWVYVTASLKQAPAMVKTKHFVTPELYQTYQTKLALECPAACLLSTKKVSVNFLPKSYTEIKLFIPILVENLPEKVAIKWNADYSAGKPCIIIRCLVPFNEYEPLQKKAYAYPISYTHLLLHKNLIPEITFLPNTTKIISIEPNVLRYVISEQ
ncbi:MAG: hypothetical protein ACKVTZ_06390 [Bacteroidia bacterium]